MEERGLVARLGTRVVGTLKWCMYCGTIAVVGGGLVFVLTAVWLGLPVTTVLRETAVFGAVAPSHAAVGVLLGAFVLVLDADLQSR